MKKSWLFFHSHPVEIFGEIDRRKKVYFQFHVRSFPRGEKRDDIDYVETKLNEKKNVIYSQTRVHLYMYRHTILQSTSKYSTLVKSFESIWWSGFTPLKTFFSRS